MSFAETFKANMKKARVDGKPVGAYANIEGFWGAVALNGSVEVFDTSKEASAWIKSQYLSQPSDTVH